MRLLCRHHSEQAIDGATTCATLSAMLQKLHFLCGVMLRQRNERDLPDRRAGVGGGEGCLHGAAVHGAEEDPDIQGALLGQARRDSSHLMGHTGFHSEEPKVREENTAAGTKTARR